MTKKLEILFDPFIKSAFADKRKYTKIKAGRRTGKTYGAVQWINTMMITHPNSKGLWVDTVQINISKYIERYFKPILGELWETVNWNKEKNYITFLNGAILDFGSAERPENLEGFEYDFGVLNEAGIILKKEGLWENTLQPMFKNAQVKVVGTPKGKTGKDGKLQKFAEMSEWAKFDEEWCEYSFSCYDSPFWEFEQLERIRAKVPSYVWQQEYLAEHVDLYENSMLSIENLGYWDSVDMSQFTKVYMHADITHTGKSTSDYFACGVIGEAKNHNFYLLDYILEKMDEETQARASIVLYSKWGSKVQKFTYDEKGHQGFGFWIKKLAKDEYNLSLPIEELNYSSNKVEHFAPHVPHFKANRVLLPKNHPKVNILQDQLLAFPNKDVNDDGVDMMAGLLDNFHVGDNLYFDGDIVSMQPTRPCIKEEKGWYFYGKRDISHKYVIGCMIQEEDASVVVIDCTLKEVIAEFYSDSISPELLGNELSSKGLLYNTAMIGVNSDKLGAGTLQMLKNKNYPSIYERVDQTTYDDRETNKVGVLMNPTTKGIMMSQLNLALKYIALFIVSNIIKEDLLRYPKDNAESMDDKYTRIQALAISYDMLKKSGYGSGKITIS